MTVEHLNFQAEVGRLLDIVAHALYSNKDVFLRELVSNASDACDKLRYLAQTDETLAGAAKDFTIRLTPDAAAGTLTVSDNGIGMDRDDLIANLGTIAKSGTASFLEQLAKQGSDRVSLIGQFGVGFYASFMVAERVTVVSRKAGTNAAHQWESDGKGGFTLSAAERPENGTDIVLHLRADDKAYLEPATLARIVKQYSDHVAVPVLIGEETTPANRAQALWTRSKSEVTPEQYNEFYRHVSHGFDEPWMTLHWQAEGTLQYASLLFVPGQKPFDLFEPARAHHVKLYVKRVFITDACEGLIPPYLRFLRGIVDSDDLALNISREMLQQNPVVSKIRAGVTRRVLNDLAKKAEDRETYLPFWENFGAVLKEGLYEDRDQRELILKLSLFASSTQPGLTSLADYIERMKPEQDSIYVLTGDTLEALRKSPQLEGFSARGLEVLLLADAVDDFWLGVVPSYKGKNFVSITRGAVDLKKFKSEEKEEAPKAGDGEIALLIQSFKNALGDAVKDVRTSDRMTLSAVCLVADENAPDLHLERILRAHKQSEQDFPRVLELNAAHPLIRALAATAENAPASAALADVAWLLFDQARIQQGEAPRDASAFATRLAAVLQSSLGTRTH
jgi:molecular chaperone HtpG